MASMFVCMVAMRFNNVDCWIEFASEGEIKFRYLQPGHEKGEQLEVG